MRQQVSDLVALIRQLRAGRVHLLGHSRGGTAWLNLANAAPELVSILTAAEGGSGMAEFSRTDSAVQQGRVDTFRRIKAQLSANEVDAALDTFLTAVSGRCVKGIPNFPTCGISNFPTRLRVVVG